MNRLLTTVFVLLGFILISSQAFALSAPTASAATTITSAGFTANWSSVAGITNYQLDVGTSSGGTQVLSNQNVGSGTSYAVSGLNPNTTYYYRVRANNWSVPVTSVNSNIISALTTPAAPVIGSPTPATAAPWDQQFVVIWSASTGATSYSVDVATDNGFLSMVSGYPKTLSSGSEATGLTGGTQYYYRVRAVNAGGSSDVSGYMPETTYATVPVTSAASGVTSSSFTANWNAPTGATSYLLSVGTTSGGTQVLNSVSTATNSYTISSGLSAGTTYYYFVRVVDNSGTTPVNSNITSVLTVPNPPVLNGRTTATGSSVVVTWAASTSATGYFIDVATDNGFTNMILNNVSAGSGTSYTVNGVTPGTNYYYRVRASNASGTSVSSGATFIDFTAPTLISLTVGANSSDPSPVLISTGVSLNGGPYVRSLTPFLTATFSEPVLGVQYSSSNNGIVLKNSAGSIISLASPYNPVNSTTATPGTPTVAAPSAATFQPAAALANTSCATSKYSVSLSGGNSSTTLIHDAGSATPANDNALTSLGPFYFTVDTQSPVVSSVTPANNANGVSLNQSITVVFTENCSMDNTTFTPANIQLTNSDGTVIPTTVTVSASPFTTITITPASLEYNTTYTLTLTNIADAAGNMLTTNNGTAGSYSSVFTTSAESATNFTIIPSFLSAPVTPNVLIILDNSNSMDETLTTGDAIGSFNCTNPNDMNTCSRSVLARQALINLINTYAGKINIGLMSYYLPDNTSKSWYVYDNFYFVSYDPRTYCGIIPPPASCYSYCVTENPRSYAGTDYGVGVAGVNYTPSTYEADCNSACRTGQTISAPVVSYTGIFNSNFQANIREPIINGTSDVTSNGGSALNGAKRQTYCSNIYPKTVAYNYTDNAAPPNTGTLYHSIVGTFYTTSNSQGTAFLNAESPQGVANYTTNESHTTSSNYYYYRQKATPTSYPYNTGYASSFANTAFQGTDDDLANGFLNYGQSNMFYPPYNGAAAPTWSSTPYTVSGGNTGGFLHVPAAINNPSNNTQLNALLNKIGASGFKNNATGYMACTSSGAAANRCSYIVNAGATPTASTLQDALNYLNGTLPAGKTQANAAPSTPISSSCQKTFIIYVTDGLPSVDDGTGSVTDATSLVTGFNAAGATVTVPGGTVLSKLNALRCPSSPTAANCGVSNTINGATVKSDVMTYILGLSMTPQAGTLLDQMAVAGGTADANGHAYYANDPTGLNNALVTIFQNILSQLSAGTASSILNNSQGSGANMLQAVFYPNKTFDSNTQCGWIGEMQNLWYYVDPALNNSSVREDTNNDKELNLKSDKIATFYFDTSQNKTLVSLNSDANGDGIADSSTPDATVSPDYVKALWKAGVLLWSRNLSSDPRTIYTGYGSSTGSTPSLLAFSLFPTNPQLDLLQIPAALTLAQRQAKATTLLSWVAGSDQPNDADGTSYRSRQVTMGTCSNDASLRCSVSSDCTISGTSGTCNSQTQAWKLGDIISSTPKIVSTLKLNNYDLAAPSGYNDTSYSLFAAGTTYANRGMVFVGGNDGMLHAFKLGVLQELSGKYDKAQINGSNLGREEWAFVPTSVLPYLTYLTNPAYQHMYLVDKTPSVADVSIGTPTGCVGDYSTCTKDATTWRTIIIGGMGIGGAAKSATDACVAPAACVKPPIPDTGLSSYFALDVTDPEAPKYLWEFNGDPTHSNYLGYSTTGPAIVRIAYKDANGIPDNTKNGKWFAVFASGPTGPIDTTLNKFNGQSDQDLRIFIVDLATGALVKTIDTGITNAFGGTLTTSWVDLDRANSTANGFYSDDAIYIGYTQLDTTAGTWTKGGIIRLFTQESSTPESADPTKQWLWSTLISGIGPVTTSIAKLQDRANGNFWIYFGTGRYFYKGDDPSLTTTQRIYGVKEPCYSSMTNSLNLACTTQATSSTTTNCSTVLGTATGLCDQSGSIATGPSATLDNSISGWFVTLDPASGTAYSERVVTDPVALTNGNVFFTTFKPNSDVCAFGGNTLIWALNYNTGGVPVPATMLGTALVQSSTGAFAEIALKTAFANPGNQRLFGRRTASAIQGVPPASQGLAVVTSPKPSKKIIHVREK